jgi:uncharacterized UPF0146 family protein
VPVYFVEINDNGKMQPVGIGFKIKLYKNTEGEGTDIIFDEGPPRVAFTGSSPGRRKKGK